MRIYLINRRCLNLILLLLFGGVPICGQQGEPSEAYFIVAFPPKTETFIIKVTDPQTIQQGRHIIATGAHNMVAGTLIKKPVYYNSPWSYHLDPKSIGFPEGNIELCDASITHVEANLDDAWPDWCPWTSRLVKEIPPPPKPGNENIAPTISMRWPYADNTFTDVAPGTIMLEANADDPDGTIVKVVFKTGTTIAETTTYPYRFTWSSLVAGSYTVSATAIDNSGASTTSRSVTFLINGGPPLLLSDGDTSKAAALESVTLQKEPFTVISELSFSSDRRTRLVLFGVNLELLSGENISAITVQAEDSQQRAYVLPLEAVRGIHKFSWLTQLTVKIPDELQGVGDVWLSVLLRGKRSNRVLINIR